MTFKGKTCTIEHSENMSGLMTITIKDGSITIDGEDILSMVAEYVKQYRITQLENSTPNEILLGNSLTVGM